MVPCPRATWRQLKGALLGVGALRWLLPAYGQKLTRKLVQEQTNKMFASRVRMRSLLCGIAFRR